MIAPLASPRTDAPSAAPVSLTIDRIMAANRVPRITDAPEVRLAQLEQRIVELEALLQTERAVNADLLERNAALRDGAPALVNETIRLRAEVAQLGDRLGDYAGERWPHCPNCAGVEMAVTDGGETLECVA